MPSRSRSRSPRRSNLSEERSTRKRSEDRSEVNEERKRRRKGRTGWDDAPSDSSLGMASLSGSLAQAEKELEQRQAQAANIAALMQTKASFSQLCRIYIGSLDYALTENDIRSVFTAFGTIVNIDMPKEGARSKGFCFVEYTTPESAEMALTTMQGFVLKGRTIKVGRPTALGGGVGLPGAFGSMAFSNGATAFAPLSLGSSVSGLTPPPAGPSLSTSTGDATVAAGVSAAQAGVMAAASLIASRTNPTATPTGGAPPTPPSSFLPTAPTSSLAGKLSPSAPPPSMVQNCGIYVGGIPFSFNTTDVKQIFQCFGSILKCSLIPAPDRPGTHKGFGFIEFSTPEQAKTAIETMNGFDVAGKKLKVNYATAAMAASQTDPLSALNMATSTIPPLSGGPAMPQTSFASPPPPPVDGSAFLSSEEMMMMSDAVEETCPSSTTLLLQNMVMPEEVDNDLKEEIEQECGKYGQVQHVFIHTIQEDVRIFVTFTSAQEASSALPQLKGRWFGGRQIQCRLYPPALAAAGNFSA